MNDGAVKAGCFGDFRIETTFLEPSTVAINADRFIVLSFEFDRPDSSIITLFTIIGDGGDDDDVSGVDVVFIDFEGAHPRGLGTGRIFPSMGCVSENLGPDEEWHA